MSDLKDYVFDTSALLALIDNEAGAEIVKEILYQAVNDEIQIFISIMTIVELCYRFLRQQNNAYADMKIAEIYAMPLAVIEYNETFIYQTSIYKATGKMSLADACIASLAKNLNAMLVHKDPEYITIAHDIQQLPLPFKPKVKNISHQKGKNYEK